MHTTRKEPVTRTRRKPIAAHAGTRLPKGCTYLLILVLLAFTACYARRDYNEALQEDTVEAYETFLDKHSDKKKYSSQAETRLDLLSYQQARRQDTFSAYIDYLKRFPSGKFSKLAEKRAEEIRAEELEIHLYRALPQDYYDQVSTRKLPYRILVRSSEAEGEISDHLERKWYKELARRGLFVPMNPRETYPVSPDLTLYLRESVIRLCKYPLAFVEAEVWAGDEPIKTYRIAGDRTDPYLLYEIFKDRELYDALFQIPDKEKKAVAERFERLEKEAPRPGSIAFEFEIKQESSEWDEEATLAFVGFLKQQPFLKGVTIFPRGQPPDLPDAQRVYFRTDPKTHAPFVRKRWSTTGPSKRWNRWNSKWILRERDYCFKMMVLDMLDLLDSPPPAPLPARKR